MSNNSTNNEHIYIYIQPFSADKGFHIWNILLGLQMFFRMFYVEIIINSKEVTKKYTGKS